MKNSLTQKDTPFKQNTKHDWVRILRQFILWMIENEYSNLPERKVRRIQVPTKDIMTHKAADLLTPEEVKALLAACRSLDSSHCIACSLPLLALCKYRKSAFVPTE